MSTRPCTQCGALFSRQPSKGNICSRLCADAARRKQPEVRTCQSCKKTFTGGTAQRKFCSWECSQDSRFPQRLNKRNCAHCGKLLKPAQKAVCSNACRYAAHHSGAYRSSNNRSPWNEAQSAILRHHYPIGTSFEEIAAFVNAAGEHQLRTRSQLFAWTRALGVKREIRPSRPFTQRAMRSEVTPRSTGPRPRSIVLWQVYRLSSELGLPLNQRGDVAALSRAMKREDPTHPGFRLVSGIPNSWGTM